MATKARNAAELQIEMLRQASLARRFRMMRSISTLVVELSRGGMKRARPELDERGIDLWFLELNYGRMLASKVKDYLEHRG